MKRQVLAAVVALSTVSGCFLALDTTGLSGGEPSTGDERPVPSVEAGTDSNTALDAAPAPMLAQDTFSRTTTDELGRAEIGGAWSTTGNSTAFAVSDGEARIQLEDASTRTARLTAVTTDDADVQLVITTDKVTNGTAYLGVVGRAIGNDEYRCRLIIEDGAARATLTRRESGDTLTHLAASSPLFPVTAGEPTRIRCSVTGTAPTLLRMKLWRAGLAEPDHWTLTASDATRAFQTSGAVGVHLYMSGASNGAMVVLLDDLFVRPASLMP